MHTDHSHLGGINVQGVDAKKFLQGQLTYNVNLVQPDANCLAAHCNPQGRIISLFYLHCLEDVYTLRMHRSLAPIALAALKKYAVFFKVELSEIIASDDDNESEEAWRASNIEKGIPTIYAETSGLFLPHDINLDLLHAIHFDKGCYTGQEIIARMHYRGKIKNRLHKAHIQSHAPPHPGADIYTIEGKPGGTIVDAVKKGYNEYDLLIVTNESLLSDGLFLSPTDKNTVLMANNGYTNAN